MGELVGIVWWMHDVLVYWFCRILLAITFELDLFSLKLNINKVGLGIEHGE